MKASVLRVCRQWLLAGVVTMILLEGPGRLAYGIVTASRSTNAVLADVASEELRTKLRHDFLDAATKIQYAYDMFLGWRAKANQQGKTYKINRQGRRDDVDYEAPASPSVFLTGGSAAWSWGVADNRHTLPSELSRALGERLPSTERPRVFNMAEQAYGLRQEGSLILQHLEWRPAVVVFYDGFNDTHTVFLGKDPGRVRTWQSLDEILTTSLAETTGSSFVLTSDSLAKGSPTLLGWRLLRRMTARLNASADDGPRRLTSDEADAIRSFFRGEITRQHQILQALGIKTLFVLQPTGYVDKPVHQQESSLRVDGEWWRDAYRVLDDEYANLAEHDGIQTVSLTRLFKNETRPVYLDPVHMNELGIHVVADVLSKEVAALTDRHQQ